MPIVEAGLLLLHYRLVEEIGKGSMGVVFRAEDTKLQRVVAVKILQRPHDDVARRRLLREARLACALRHPGVVSVYALESTDELDFLVMEHLDAESLRDRLLVGPLPVDEILRAGIQVAEALGAAHAAGVLHRDIKPANVLLCSNGQAKLLDFGVAQAMEPPRVDTPDATATDTDESAPRFAGTVAYMSPEQIRGDTLDARSDLFSLGSTLYEVATGRRPFAGATTVWLGHAILHDAPKAPSSVRADLPHALDEILLRALAKDPAARPASAEAFAADLRAVAENRTPGERSPARKEPRRGWPVPAALAGAFGIAVAAASVLARRESTPRVEPAGAAAAPSPPSEAATPSSATARVDATSAPSAPSPTPSTGASAPGAPRSTPSARATGPARSPVGDGIY